MLKPIYYEIYNGGNKMKEPKEEIKEQKNSSLMSDELKSELEELGFESIPTQMKCVKCGSWVKARKDIVMKRIERFEGLKNLLVKYHCRKCRNQSVVKEKLESFYKKEGISA